MPKQGMEQVSEVTEYSLSRKLPYQEKAFYSCLGHFSIPVQFSKTSLKCTNQSIRGERAPLIRAYVEAGTIGEQVASERSE